MTDRRDGDPWTAAIPSVQADVSDAVATRRRLDTVLASMTRLTRPAVELAMRLSLGRRYGAALLLVVLR